MDAQVKETGLRAVQAYEEEELGLAFPNLLRIRRNSNRIAMNRSKIKPFSINHINILIKTIAEANIKLNGSRYNANVARCNASGNYICNHMMSVCVVCKKLIILNRQTNAHTYKRRQN